MKKHLSHLYILIAGISWGMIGLFTKNLSAFGLAPRSVVLIRNMGCLAVMTVLFFIMDRKIFRIKLKHLHYFAATGVIGVVMFSLLYFLCQKHCSLSIAGILLYTAPAIVMVLSAVIWRDAVTKRKLIALALTFLSCVMVSGVFNGALSISAIGLLYGLGSALFYALYTIFSRFALDKYSSYTVTYYTFLWAAVASLFITSPTDTFSVVFSGLMPFMLSFGMVIVCTVLPFILYTKGLSQTESGKASILASVEPVSAALVGIIAFGEPMTMAVILGLVCILAAVYILS